MVREEWVLFGVVALVEVVGALEETEVKDSCFKNLIEGLYMLMESLKKKEETVSAVKGSIFKFISYLNL